MPRERGLADGDVVRVFNDRGACLAGLVVDDRLRRGVVQLSTGAWYDPEDPADPDAMCVHGNPNVLTADVGTSSLAKGCTGAHVLVRGREVRRPAAAGAGARAADDQSADDGHDRGTELGRTLAVHLRRRTALRRARLPRRRRGRVQGTAARLRRPLPRRDPRAARRGGPHGVSRPWRARLLRGRHPRRDRRPLRRRPIVAATRPRPIAGGLRVRGEHRRTSP